MPTEYHIYVGKSVFALDECKAKRRGWVSFELASDEEDFAKDLIVETTSKEAYTIKCNLGFSAKQHLRHITLGETQAVTIRIFKHPAFKEMYDIPDPTPVGLLSEDLETPDPEEIDDRDVIVPIPRKTPPVIKAGLLLKEGIFVVFKFQIHRQHGSIVPLSLCVMIQAAKFKQHLGDLEYNKMEAFIEEFGICSEIGALIGMRTPIEKGGGGKSKGGKKGGKNKKKKKKKKKGKKKGKKKKKKSKKKKKKKEDKDKPEVKPPEGGDDKKGKEGGSGGKPPAGEGGGGAPPPQPQPPPPPPDAGGGGGGGGGGMPIALPGGGGGPTLDQNGILLQQQFGGLGGGGILAVPVPVAVPVGGGGGGGSGSDGGSKSSTVTNVSINLPTASSTPPTPITSNMESGFESISVPSPDDGDWSQRPLIGNNGFEHRVTMQEFIDHTLEVYKKHVGTEPSRQQLGWLKEKLLHCQGDSQMSVIMATKLVFNCKRKNKGWDVSSSSSDSSSSSSSSGSSSGSSDYEDSDSSSDED